MDSVLFEKEIAMINRRYVSLCFRLMQKGEVAASLKMNTDLGFLRAIGNLSEDKLDFLSNCKSSLLTPAISSISLTAACQLNSHQELALFVQGVKK